MTTGQLYALGPIIALSLTAVVLMLQASVKRNQTTAWVLSTLGLLLSLWSCGYAAHYSQQVTPLLRVDHWSLLVSALLLISAIVTLVLSRQSFPGTDERKEEYYLLLILSVLGAVVLVQASHIASLFLGLELLGIALYTMISFPEKGELPLEAAIKYLVLSAGASAMLLFGFALIYAATGALSYTGLGDRMVVAYNTSPTLLLAGSALVFAGFGFKLSVVPFHMWTPDVYQGAPTPVTAFLATVSKGAVFFALSRLFLDTDLHNYPGLLRALTVLAVASMLGGNLLALLQTDIKRLLAYSSIAHFGYLLVVLISAGGNAPLAGDAVMFYLCAYVATTLAAFTVVASMAGDDDCNSNIDSYRGLFWSSPLNAVVLTVAMLSLAGIPLTAGFVGKFYVINVGIADSRWLLLFTLLLSSAIAIYYYLRVVFVMSAQGDHAAESARTPVAHSIVAVILLLAVLLLGAWPQPFISLLNGI